MMRAISLGLIMLSVLLLAGCGGVDEKNFTIKSTITATYDGKAVQGSAILFQRLENNSRILTRGEATVLELGNGKRAYLLLVDRNFKLIYPRVIYNAFGPPKWNYRKAVPPGTIESILATPAGTYAIYDYKHWANRAGSRYYGHPLLVAFGDESDPTSIFLIETEEATQLFGQQFVFGEWSIERMANSTPLTKSIEGYLPWVNRKYSYWVGKSFDYLETPHRTMSANKAKLKHNVTRSHFSSIDRESK